MTAATEPRVPPHSVEVEQSVLGGLLLDNLAWHHADTLTESDFYRHEHRLVFAAISALMNAGQPADMITVFEQLQSRGKADDCGGLPYLNALAQSVPSASNLRRYAEIVREKALAREAAGALSEAAENVFAGRSVAEVLPLLRERMDALSRPALPSWAESIKGWVPPTDLATREVNIDFAVEGLIQSGKVGALVAAGGTGKTTLLLTLGACIALGRPFLGMQVRQGSFALVSNDDSQADLDGALTLVVRAMHLAPGEVERVARHVRVISLQGNDGCTTFVTTVRGEVVPTGVESQMAEALAGIPDLVGVAFDTLRQFSGGQSNDEQIVKLTIAACGRIAAKTGAFVVMAHHTGKQNYRDGVTDMYAGSGSAAIADNSRFLLLLQTATWADIEQQVERRGHEQGDPLVLRPTRGSLLVKAGEPIFLVRDGHGIERIAGRTLTRDQQLDKRDREILAAVRGGADSKNAIHAAIRGKKASVLGAVDDLIGRGHIVADDAGGSRGGSRPLMVSATGARLLDQQEIA